MHIQSKVSRVLHIISVTLILILIRVWYLAVVQKEEYFQLSRKPQRRVVIEHVERATIRDRFNVPLALNKIQYNAAIYYGPIREIPSVVWKTDETGKRSRFYARMDYIEKLSILLAEELHMSAREIEDIIHGKACLFPHTPFVIKEDITEAQYFKLKMLEKTYAGISMQKSSKRVYPQGKTASDVIGFLGTINQNEYKNIAQEIAELQKYIAEREEGTAPFLPKGFSNPIEVRQRLKSLSEKSYTICDSVGKMGIEGAFDEDLRGTYGKRIYEVDTKGNFLRELPGSKPASAGRRLILTISSELQEYAEALLSQNESTRNKENYSLSTPWIKGGAVVALIPQTGEVVALASYPRFNPSDFVPTFDPALKKEQLSRRLRWIENETHIKEIWDGIRPLEKECYSFSKKAFHEETLPLTWNNYLEATLAPKSQILASMRKISDIKTAFLIQKSLTNLSELCGGKEMPTLVAALYSGSHFKKSRNPIDKDQKKSIQEQLKNCKDYSAYKNYLDLYLSNIPHNDDQLLLIDLCRMLVNIEVFSPELLELVGGTSLSFFKTQCQANSYIQSLLKPHLQDNFHKVTFAKWRETHFKEYLKEKRAEEKLKKRYAKPYTEYLELIEKKMFAEYWEESRFSILNALLKEESPILDLGKNPKFALLKQTLGQLPENLKIPYLKTLRPFNELNRPLYGKYKMVRSLDGKQLEKHLASSFYPIAGFGYGRSQAFRQATAQGSVFKLVTSYEALKERYDENKELNPLTLVDDIKAEGINTKEGQVLGSFLNGEVIRRKYKGGILPRKTYSIGQIGLTGAIETSSNLYFSILASDYIQDPTYLAGAARQLGFGEKTGIELPGEISGTIPNDLSHNRTGLYSFAIGQHSLVVTPLQTALMLSTIANHGNVIKPKIVKVIAGKETKSEENPFNAEDYPLKDALSLVGFQFPLFTESKEKKQQASVQYSPIEVKRSLFFPEEIRDMLLNGMERTLTGPKGTVRPSIIRAIPEFPQSLRDYINLQHQLVAKTGTAEILYKHSIDAETPPTMENHVWFAGISFKDPHRLKWSEPDLVVVVYIRFGRSGKDGALIAGQIVKKWREICAKYGATSYLKDEE